MALTLILGNQLYREWLKPGSPLQLGAADTVLMVEDLGVASAYRYHQLRLLHTFVAMRSFRDHLVAQGVRVQYHELPASEALPFLERLALELKLNRGQNTSQEQNPSQADLRIAEVPDPAFQRQLESFCTDRGVGLTVLPAPDFLESAADSRRWFEGKRRPFMKTFYERQRQRLGLLLEADGSPVGGRWSFDTENRRRLPKGYSEPSLPKVAPSTHEGPVRDLIRQYFEANPGQLGELFIPFDHAGADRWLECFVRQRFADFGPFEDALSQQFDTLQHSLLSPLLNCGLLNPAAVIQAVIDQAGVVSIASLEGFVRQVIGWREFVRGIHLVHGERQKASNFWNHQRGLAPCWDSGTTGLLPLDQAIDRVNRLGYNHHIERLMVISNLMLLCEVHPHQVHRWFMERYLDSYEWVMGPNVFGMGQMSDGGIFATKPYICGSNYILKMGDFKRGPWCDIWDGLYWRFIGCHRGFFQANPRLSMMVKLLDRMEEQKRQRLFGLADQFMAAVTTSP